MPVSLKKHKLAVSIDENFCLLGIVSDEPDYKLCWLINQHIDFNFTRVDDLKLFQKKHNMEQEIALFFYEDESTMMTYRLIPNRASAGLFLSDLQHIDYLLHIQGDLVRDDIQNLISRISKMDAVRMCVPVDLSKIREQERLHLW